MERKRLHSKLFNTTCKEYAYGVGDALWEMGIENNVVWTTNWIVRFTVSKKRNLYAEFRRKGERAAFDSVNVYEGYGGECCMSLGLLNTVEEKICRLIGRFGSDVFTPSVGMSVDGNEIGILIWEGL